MPKIQCPLPGCGKVVNDEKEIIAHFKEKHPEHKKLRIGKKKVDMTKK
jgi:hypothetical protein